MATSKQASTYVTNTLLQCSPTSVGLAQAHPNHRFGNISNSSSDSRNKMI